MPAAPRGSSVHDVAPKGWLMLMALPAELGQGPAGLWRFVAALHEDGVAESRRDILR